MSAVYNAFLEELDNEEYIFKNITNNLEPEQYISILKQNLLSNFKVFIVNLTEKKEYNATIMHDNSLTINNHHSLLNCVILYKRVGEITYHFVKTEYCEKNKTIITVQPPIQYEKNSANKITIYDCGYIGDMLHNYSSLTHIGRNLKMYNKIMTSILNPNIYIAGEYVKTELQNKLYKCNQTQYEAIHNLKYNIELIHGPPGTGKSTTIANIIFSKIPTDHNILCTAVQNQAIETLLIKLRETKIDVLVFGRTERLKTESQKYSFENICENNAIINNNKKLKNSIYSDVIELEKIIKNNVTSNKKITIGDNKIIQIMKKYDDINEYISEQALLDILNKKIHYLHEQIDTEKHNILNSVRVYLSTTASAYKLYALFGTKKKIDTVILDEAGATTELNIPALIRLQPTNIIMIGDHKQLQGYCNVSNYILNDKLYKMSMMERLIMSNRHHAMLSVQYRMDNKICTLISNLFYDKQLISDRSCYNISVNPVQWIDVNGEEDVLDDYNKLQRFDISADDSSDIFSTTSLYNAKEIFVVYNICNQPENKGRNILILSPYNSQMHILKLMLADNTNIDVRSVDSSQGMESDVVIISLVKSNNKMQFLNNPNRMCVMLSRARHNLYIVGNKKLFNKQNNTLWKQCINYIGN